MDNRTRYEGIDGLKAYAIIGIALMHVLANGEYGIGGFVFERLIPSFTNLVFLFMMVSGFGMCCGYYQKIVDQKISVEDFYKKRYIKIWPYFALLCALDRIFDDATVFNIKGESFRGKKLETVALQTSRVKAPDSSEKPTP